MALEKTARSLDKSPNVCVFFQGPVRELPQPQEAERERVRDGGRPGTHQHSLLLQGPAAAEHPGIGRGVGRGVGQVV